MKRKNITEIIEVLNRYLVKVIMFEKLRSGKIKVYIESKVNIIDLVSYMQELHLEVHAYKEEIVAGEYPTIYFVV